MPCGRLTVNHVADFHWMLRSGRPHWPSERVIKAVCLAFAEQHTFRLGPHLIMPHFIFLYPCTPASLCGLGSGAPVIYLYLNRCLVHFQRCMLIQVIWSRFEGVISCIVTCTPFCFISLIHCIFVDDHAPFICELKISWSANWEDTMILIAITINSIYVCYHWFIINSYINSVQSNILIFFKSTIYNYYFSLVARNFWS